MGSGPWRGTAVTVALVLVASILRWCATTSRAAETYEGYGPIEDQLQVNNPPIPHPSGRGSCATTFRELPTRCGSGPPSSAISRWIST